MRSFAMSRSEVGRSESSVLLRTEVVARRSDGDGKDLWMTSEVIEWSTGSARFQAFASLHARNGLAPATTTRRWCATLR